MEKCSEHAERQIKYYCLIHSQMCCDVCKMQQHKMCKDVKTVEELAIEITKIEECHTISRKLEIIYSKTRQILKDAEDKMKLTVKNHSDLVKAVQQTRKDFNVALDKIEEELLQQAAKFKENNVSKLETMSQKFKKTGLEIEALQKQIEDLQTKTQERERFFIMKKVENKLKVAEDMIVGIDNEINVEGYMFLPNASLQTILQKPGSMGKFYPDLWAEQEMDLKIRTSTDTCHSWITGSAALPGKLVVTDYGTSKVKVIDIEKLQVLSELAILAKPWAVTKVSDRKVAITVPYVKKIIIVKIDDFPSIEKEIGTTSKCHGIAHWDGRFIVTFSKKDRVEIIDMTGVVQHTITTEITGQKLFSFPEYVTLSPNNNQIVYVSNFCGNSVVSIGLDGKIKGVFKDKNLHQPRQTTVDSNEIIYLCGYGSNTILLMSQDLKKIKTLLSSSADLHKPRSICLSEKGDRLFVDLCPDKIRVFKVTNYLTAATQVPSKAERNKLG